MTTYWLEIPAPGLAPSSWMQITEDEYGAECARREGLRLLQSWFLPVLKAVDFAFELPGLDETYRIPL